MKIFKFLKSRTFFINLAAAIIFVGVIIYVVMISLDSYTHHDQYLKVPDFKGISKTRCEQIAKSQNIRIKVIDSLYVKNYKPGAVIDQHPKAGHNIKENRLIMLTICSSKPESVPFPNLKNSAYRQTINTLNSLGFKLGKISYIDSKYKNLLL
jgi:beta-lactam-binding protein with PASTA domain